MYTILITADNQLKTSVAERIMQRSKLVDFIHFLTDPTYKSESMRDYTVTLEYVLPVSKQCFSMILTASDELYKDYLEYKLPFDTNLTSEPGKVEFTLTFSRVEMQEDGQLVQHVRKTDSSFITIIPISKWSDLIPDSLLSPLDQRILKQDAQIQQLTDLVLSVDDNHVDNLIYTDGKLQLSKKGVPVGDEIQISGDDSDSNNQGKTIKVVEF